MSTPLPPDATAPTYTKFDAAEVRGFGNAAIDRAVAHALSRIDEDDTFALVAIGDNQSARVAVVVKPGDHWSVAGYLEKPWSGPLTYGVEVIVSG